MATAKKSSASKPKAKPLTAAKRKALPKTAFALPAQKAYPIDTPARARNALARASQNATPSQQATIRRAVAKKYPSIQVTTPKQRKRSK